MDEKRVCNEVKTVQNEKGGYMVKNDFTWMTALSPVNHADISSDDEDSLDDDYEEGLL